MILRGWPRLAALFALLAVIEIARALLAGPTPRRAVIILIDDGEELGLLGARAFVRAHPWASDASVVLNFDARGTGGQTGYLFAWPALALAVALLVAARRASTDAAPSLLTSLAPVALTALL